MLQDLFKALPDKELITIAISCGRVLAGLSAYQFPRCGAFGANLEIVEEYGAPSQLVPAVVHRALFEGRAGARLGPELREAGGVLPRDWLPRSRLVDVVSQVTFLDDSQERPR